MKLTKPIVKMLSDLMALASKLGTSSIIIEPGAVRAIDENRSVVVLSEHTMDLPFASLAISRVDLFKTSNSNTSLSLFVNIFLLIFSLTF